MKANDNGTEERVSAASSVEPLDDMMPLQPAFENAASKMTKARPAIIRLWNRGEVR